MLIQTVLQISAEEAVWWSMLALPAIYGALIVFPIASMTRDHFGKGAGVIAAWLIAFMPSHVTQVPGPCRPRRIHSSVLVCRFHVLLEGSKSGRK